MDWAEWLKQYGGWLLALSVVTFVATLVLVPVILARMPEDYFLHPRSALRAVKHPVLRLLLRIFKNALGGLFVLFGLIMLLTPGQGVLTLLIGVGLLDFPGKRRAELAIIRKPRVLRAINWIRARSGRAPLQVPPRPDGHGGDGESHAQ